MKQFFYKIALALFCLFFSLYFTTLRGEWDPKKLEPWEQETITDIFLTMSEKTVPSLLFDAFRLTRLGDQIQHIPPLQFLGFLMTDPKLKDCIRIISRSYFKWPPFIEGIQNNMEREACQGSLFSDLAHFAKLVGGDYHKLKALCEQRKWEEFVRALL